MSPNEAQLRSALHDGEGASLDVDAVVTGAIRARRVRRQRVASVLGAVVVVAGVAGAARTLGGRAPDRARPAIGAPTVGLFDLPDRAGAAAGPGSVSASSPTGPARQRADAPVRDASQAGRLAAAIGCPAELPRFALPGGGGTGQFGGSGAFYGTPVAAAKVCAYPNGGNGLGASQVLTTTQAAELAASLDSADSARGNRECPNSTTGAGATSLAIYAVTASGHRLRAVTATLGCPGLVTNGTAARYFWSPPDFLSALVGHAVPIPTAVPTS